MRTTRRRDSMIIWSLIILISAVLTALVVYTRIVPPLQPPLVFWFLLVCPGMAFVRLFNLWDPISEWALAIALSLAIDSIVAMALLYAGQWNPSLGLRIVLVTAVVGALLPAPRP
ncbi:MAG TPA: hypothetical protein VHO48_05090, partial [Anaerolineaceae bacterium]|nr:hypothetical protein [Anaerolineaceae bacterium]